MHYRFLLLLSLAIGGIVYIQIDRFRSFQSANIGSETEFHIGSDHGPSGTEPVTAPQPKQTAKSSLETLPAPDFGSDIPAVFQGTKAPPNLAKMGKPVSGTQSTNKDIYPPGTFVKEAKNSLGDSDGTDVGL